MWGLLIGPPRLLAEEPTRVARWSPMTRNGSKDVRAAKVCASTAAWWRSVCALRQDGRRSLTAVSRETGMSVSTLFDRLRVWPLWRRATVLLDFRRLQGVHAWFLVGAVPRLQLGAVEEYLRAHPGVNTVQRVATDADFLVEAVVPDAAALEAFVDGLVLGLRVGAVRVLYVLSDVVREGYLTDPLRYPGLTGGAPLVVGGVQVRHSPDGAGEDLATIGALVGDDG